MNIVNDGLPEPVYHAILNDSYDAGGSDFTPSSLIAPIYQRQVIKRLGKEVKTPASSLIFALLGTSVHHMIEKASKQLKGRYWAERRLYGNVYVDDGRRCGGTPYTIGAQLDLYDTNKNAIYDFKVASVFSSKGNAKIEWVLQLNIQRWCLWKQHGIDCKNLNIVGIWRDWSMHKAREKDYPDKQSSIVYIPAWPFDKIEEYIERRVKENIESENQPLDQMDSCSPDEVWAKPTTYAVKKKGVKRAMRIFNSMDEAVTYQEKQKVKTEIETRKGERTRCASYCAVSGVCPAYQKYLEIN